MNSKPSFKTGLAIIMVVMAVFSFAFMTDNNKMTGNMVEVTRMGIR